MRTSIVVPAYNEAATIAEVVARIASFGRPIVVDDGSTDSTGVIARSAGAEVVRHDKNRGYDGAIESGFKRAQAIATDIVVTFDADGQHDPTLLPDIISPLASGQVELVIGIREKSARWSEALFNAYARLRFGVPDILCGLKGYRMSLYRVHGCFASTQSIGTELALAGLRQGVTAALISVPVRERQDQARIGSALLANCRILRALTAALRQDITTALLAKSPAAQKRDR